VLLLPLLLPLLMPLLLPLLLLPPLLLLRLTAAGNSPAIRKYSKKASRMVYELSTCPTTSNAPATVRFMFNYIMKDFSPATCQKAVGLQAKLMTTLGKQGLSLGFRVSDLGFKQHSMSLNSHIAYLLASMVKGTQTGPGQCAHPQAACHASTHAICQCM
jgi:hypothetical protein